MPTGYTAPVMEGNTSLRDYMMDCARAFGAFAHLRDEPSAPLSAPESSVPRYERMLAEAEAELEMFMTMTHDQAEVMMTATIARLKSQHEKTEVKSAEIRKNYSTVLEGVRAWRAPSAAHLEYKKFLESQLLDSMKFDASSRGVFEAPYSSVDEYININVEAATRSRDYYARALADAKEREAKNLQWINLLMEAMPEE